MKKNEKRVIFPVGEQIRFFNSIESRSILTRLEIVNKLRVHRRTYSDWRREQCSVPLSVVQKLCMLTKRSFPDNAEIQEAYWLASKAGRVGGLQKYKKYGCVIDEKIRKQKWLEWWQRTGTFKRNPILIPKKIFQPSLSEELAEFVGIMLGDGGITPFQITISVSYENDMEYSDFLSRFLYKLFRLRPAVYFRDTSVITIQLSRKNLVEYCKKIGLCVGNKVRQQIDMPYWVQSNDEYLKACLRGLMDTDGCIFQECHRIKGRRYCYPRIYFVNYSEPLKRSIFAALAKFAFTPKIHNNRAVTLERREDVIRYFSFIGTHNLKHQKRFKMFIRRSA
ncbi:hypothetical protein HY620_01845 [Candidatus Uhrbacteria bacterium]|nr:hypothetical protein [Candidatus Uhrbacteria bacterium]